MSNNGANTSFGWLEIDDTGKTAAEIRADQAAERAKASAQALAPVVTPTPVVETTAPAPAPAPG